MLRVLQSVDLYPILYVFNGLIVCTELLFQTEPLYKFLTCSKDNQSLTVCDKSYDHTTAIQSPPLRSTNTNINMGMFVSLHLVPLRLFLLFKFL